MSGGRGNCVGEEAAAACCEVRGEEGRDHNGRKDGKVVVVGGEWRDGGERDRRCR